MKKRLLLLILSMCVVLAGTACDEGVGQPLPSESDSALAQETSGPMIEADFSPIDPMGARNLTAELVISAPIELQAALEETARIYDERTENVTLTFRFTGTETLLTEIEAGAPVDIVVTSGQKQLDRLTRTGVRDEAPPVSLGDNQLLVFAHESVAELELNLEMLSEPSIVGVAISPRDGLDMYGARKRDVLNALGVPFKAIERADADSVIAYVRETEGAVGILARTEMPEDMSSLMVMEEASPEWFSPIFYQAVVLTGGDQVSQARAFLEYLRSEEGQEVFIRAGFLKENSPLAARNSR